MPGTKARKRGGVLHRRRIIERPRLIALLDGSRARLRTLIAPAGYGKTTLAEQWVNRDGRRHAWFTARPASVDVAGLALGVARAATAIVPDCDVRLREHLRAVAAPAENVIVLAELVGEELAAWPDDAWFVLDDYHELMANPNAEQFVQDLFAVAPVQLLIASRQRPSWITARKILYGEVLELNQTELAMDSYEAADVLSERSSTSASGLVALASGWPAVIGLASVSDADVDDAGAVPDALYEFFAEEVFNALPAEVQVGLTTLAIPPVLDPPLAVELLGAACDGVTSAAFDVGVLVERGARLEIHPLARAFLEAQLTHGGEADPDTVQRCVAYFSKRRDWDAAFDLVVRRGFPELVETLLEDALDDLLETARLSTIEAWCDYALGAGLGASVVGLARAELALRFGRLAEAQMHAEAAAATPSNVEVRALITAGRAAHVASRGSEAVRLLKRAEASAPTEVLRREAAWSLALAAAELDLPEARAVLEELGTSWQAPRDLVRAAGCEFTADVSAGTLHLNALDRAAQVVSGVDDPIVESGFFSMYACALAAAARYPEAREAAEELLALTERYRLNFARPYVYYAIGVAEAGLRDWRAAEMNLELGLQEARKSFNFHAERCCHGALLRTLAQRGRSEARVLAAQSVTRSEQITPAAWAEFVGSRAFAFAVFDQLDEATALLDSVRGDSRAADPAALLPLVEAIIAIKRHAADGITQVAAAAEAVFRAGVLDYLVAAYRSVPELLSILLNGPEADRVRGLILRVGDTDVAEAASLRISDPGDPLTALTPRERQVYELLRQRLTNRDIASVLVISPDTAKRHVANIYEKLGVHSRHAIALQAALERGTQATSAIVETDTGAES